MEVSLLSSRRFVTRHKALVIFGDATAASKLSTTYNEVPRRTSDSLARLGCREFGHLLAGIFVFRSVPVGISFVIFCKFHSFRMLRARDRRGECGERSKESSCWLFGLLVDECTWQDFVWILLGVWRRLFVSLIVRSWTSILSLFVERDNFGVNRMSD